MCDEKPMNKAANTKNFRHGAVVAVLSISAFALSACESKNEEVGLANPASVHCVDNGGVNELVQEENGTVGYCHFDDGSACEEWAYFEGRCHKGESLKSGEEDSTG